MGISCVNMTGMQKNIQCEKLFEKPVGGCSLITRGFDLFSYSLMAKTQIDRNKRLSCGPTPLTQRGTNCAGDYAMIQNIIL